LLIRLTIISSLSFLLFGIGYLISPRLRLEFDRYGLARFRVLVACLQLAGAAGQLAGIRYPMLGALSSGGLALMMLAAVGVRIRIGDSIGQSLPALLYLSANIYLTFAFLRA
jgi:hypothetical protein